MSIIIYLFILLACVFPSLGRNVVQTMGSQESRAWYILRQVDTQGLLFGLPQRLAKTIEQSERQTPIWQGVDKGGSIELEIKVEGEATGEIHVGFFSNPKWWIGPPVQVRSFPGPGRYVVERLAPGKYYIGAMIGSLPLPDALGVDRFWPVPIQIESGKSISVQLLLSTKFKDRPGFNTETHRGFAGQFSVTYPTQLITLRNLDNKGSPAPFCRVVFVERDQADPSKVLSFHETGTNEKGYAYCDTFDGPFSFNVQSVDFLPDNFSHRWQYRRFEKIYNTADKDVITVKWPPYPTGAGMVKGRVHDQYDKPLNAYYLTIKLDLHGSRTGINNDYAEDWYYIGYEIPITDPEGRFNIDHLVPGKYTWMVRAFDYSTYVWDFDMGEFTIADEDDSITELVLEVEAKELRYGQAFYNDGMPVYPGSFQLWFKKYTPEERLRYHTLGEGFRNRIQSKGFFRIPLSQQERRDFMKASQGYVIIDNRKGIEIGQIHIDKLSENPGAAPKLFFQRNSPRSSLLSSLLPDMNGIKTDFNLEQAKSKIVLICFWDVGQRPSRNCLIQLSKRAQELQAKDIVIIAVQASKVEKDKFDEWIKENDISFLVGMITSDEEKIHFNWGVRSLPWLILTDKKHVVHAEGFSISELEEKITVLREK